MLKVEIPYLRIKKLISLQFFKLRTLGIFIVLKYSFLFLKFKIFFSFFFELLSKKKEKIIKKTAII